MRPLPAAEKELPLTREARAGLPFLRLARLYLDPYSLFRDASAGPPSVRQRAATWNRSMRWMLLAYLRRWSTIAAGLYACVQPAETLAAQMAMLPVVAAACAVGSGIALTVAAQILIGYLLLGR